MKGHLDRLALMALAATLALLLLSRPGVVAQAVSFEAHSPETLTAVVRFFDYDESVPLNAQIVQQDEALGFQREKIVFTGGRGQRVPAYLSVPGDSGPYPVVLLMHAGASSKDSWWSATGYERALDLTRSLLESGYAVFAMDGANQGERTQGVDYVPIQQLYFGNQWWATFRAMLVETVVDYRRGMQYLRTRSDLDMGRVATVGQSLGAMTSYGVASVEPTIRVMVAGAPALAPDWLYPLTPMNLSPSFSDREILLISGSRDTLSEPKWPERLLDLIGRDSTRLVFLPSGHQLPVEYVPIALEWIRERL